MSKYETPPDFLAFIPHAIEPHWDNDWAPRLSGFPINIVYAARIEGVGLAQATYVFDPGTFGESKQSRQMRYRSTVDSNFSVVVVLNREGRMETFKYRESELICEASGPDFRTAMIHTTARGLEPDEPRPSFCGQHGLIQPWPDQVTGTPWRNLPVMTVPSDPLV
jgi:hypothetical protein